MEYRIETDTLGPVSVPAAAYWGAHTERARHNFAISGIPVSAHPHLVRALAMVKSAAAQANGELGHLSPDRVRAIREACRDIMAGRHHGQFCVDVIQGGAGTSTNMNANEVIANLALEKLGHRRGDYAHLHPIEHVNKCQSTNDTYPTALRLALAAAVQEVVEELDRLAESAVAKGDEFRAVVKIGRTQLQDAVPMTLGQEFRAFGTTIREDCARLLESVDLLLECNLGGTAIGTGITAADGFQPRALRALADLSGLPVRAAGDLFEATWDVGALMHVSGMLKRTAVKLSKICSDLRLLASGPQNGFGEIRLPARQAGSSIMPGKVNPVIPEAVNQIAFAVAGADTTVTMAADNGQLQLNAFEPVMAHVLLQAVEWLGAGARSLRTLCLDGIEANSGMLRTRAGASAGVATALVPRIGYAAAADIAKEALRSGEAVVEIVARRELMDPVAARTLVEAALAGAASPMTGSTGQAGRSPAPRRT